MDGLRLAPGASRCHAKDPLKVNAARRLVASRFVKQRAQISGFLGRVGFDHVYQGGIHVLVLPIVLQYALRPPVTLAVRQQRKGAIEPPGPIGQEARAIGGGR